MLTRDSTTAAGNDQKGPGAPRPARSRTNSPRQPSTRQGSRRGTPGKRSYARRRAWSTGPTYMPEEFQAPWSTATGFPSHGVTMSPRWPIGRNLDAVGLEPRDDQISKLTFLSGCLVTSHPVSGCSPALEDVNREKPLGDREFGSHDLVRRRPRTGAGNAGCPVGDLIPTGPSDAACKVGPPAFAAHCLDAGVVVHASVDEPPLTEGHRDDETDTHDGHGVEIARGGSRWSGKGRAEDGGDGPLDGRIHAGGDREVGMFFQVLVLVFFVLPSVGTWSAAGAAARCST